MTVVALIAAGVPVQAQQFVDEPTAVAAAAVSWLLLGDRATFAT